MPNLKSLYRDYFQKSKVFLYPLLDIKRGHSIVPIQTFVVWKEMGIKATECKLMCLYHNRSDKEFKEFEKVKLKGNKLYQNSFLVDDDSKIVYIFDYSKYSKDFKLFLKGKYSKLSIEFKRKIKDFFRLSGNNFVYIESFLHPEKYYALYSELLNVEIDTLKEVVELCSAPDMEKESLSIELSITEIKRKIDHES